MAIIDYKTMPKIDTASKVPPKPPSRINLGGRGARAPIPRLWTQPISPSTTLKGLNNIDKSSHPEVLLRKGVLKICSKRTGESSCRSVTLIKLQSNFIEIGLQYGYSPVYLLHTFRTPFPRSTYGWALSV